MSSSDPWRNPRPAPPLAEIRTRVQAKSMIPAWLRAWWPALLWAALIFNASTDSFSSEHTSRILKPLLEWLIPSITTSQFELIHHLIRKSAHFVEYFIFYLVLFRGVRGGRRGWQLSWAATAWFIAAAYSALDEIHQSFIPSRTASPWDSLIDSTGALIAFFVVFLFYRTFRKSAAESQT